MKINLCCKRAICAANAICARCRVVRFIVLCMLLRDILKRHELRGIVVVVVVVVVVVSSIVPPRTSSTAGARVRTVVTKYRFCTLCSTCTGRLISRPCKHQPTCRDRVSRQLSPSYWKISGGCCVGDRSGGIPATIRWCSPHSEHTTHV